MLSQSELYFEFELAHSKNLNIELNQPPLNHHKSCSSKSVVQKLTITVE